VDAEQLRLLRELLTETRVLALAVLVEGEPAIGLTPFLAAPDLQSLVVHGSRLARHSRGLQPGARFSAVLHQPDRAELDPMRLPRLLLDGTVEEVDPTAPGTAGLRAAWIDRFESGVLTVGLGDFAFHRLRIASGRLVAGFGQAFGIGERVLREAAASAG
jgi:hypothetical protein